MKNRSPAAVFILSLVTFGIYTIVWEVKTKNELNSRGADIPTAWLIIVPIANLYWVWKYSEGVEKVTGGKISAVMTIVLFLLLSYVGVAILQSQFNKLGDTAAAGLGMPPVSPIQGDVNNPTNYPPAPPTVYPPTTPPNVPPVV